VELSRGERRGREHATGGSSAVRRAVHLFPINTGETLLGKGLVGCREERRQM
jgi:hypothetical protein